MNKYMHERTRYFIRWKDRTTGRCYCFKGISWSDGKHWFRWLTNQPDLELLQWELVS